MNGGYFLAVFLFDLHLVAAESLKYALLGGTVSLNPEMKPSDGIQVLWRHNRDIVVEFNGNEQRVYDPFEERIILDWHTAELEITGLRYEDSGDYELEVYMKQKMHRFPFKLKIIDKVSRPAISCEMKEDNQATLICSAESRQSESLMKFEWSSRGNKQPGPNLTIPLGDQNNDEEYSCTVSNPLSGETTTFTAKDCYPEKSLTGIIVGSLIAVLLVVLGLLLFWKQRQKQKPEIKRSHHEEEALIDRQSTFRSPQPLGSLTTETGGITPENEINSTPDKTPSTPKTSSPSAMNPSKISDEDSISEQKEEIKLDQGSGELPQNTAGESSLEEENQSDEENRSDREQDPLPGGQSTSPLQQQENGVQENEDTESVNVKKRIENIENRERKPDKETNSTPDKPPPSLKMSPPSATNPSKISDEGGISEQKEEIKLDQGNGGLPQNTAGESSSEEENQPHEENRSDREQDPLPGGQSTSPLQQQENGAQENDDTESEEDTSKNMEEPVTGGPSSSQSNSDPEVGNVESDKETNSTHNKTPPSPKTSSPPATDSSKISDEDGISEQKEEIKLDQDSGELPQNTAGESSSEDKNQSHEEDTSKNMKEPVTGGPSSSQSNSDPEVDDVESDKETNSTPDKPPPSPKMSPPPATNPSKISDEDGISEQKEEIKSDQGSGELPQNTAGESSSEDKNQSHEENRSDREQDLLPGGQSTSPLQQQKNGAQGNAEVQLDKETNSTPDKPPPRPKTSSPPATDSSKTSQGWFTQTFSRLFR